MDIIGTSMCALKIATVIDSEWISVGGFVNEDSETGRHVQYITVVTQPYLPSARLETS